jgi:hypothetical protein
VCAKILSEVTGKQQVRTWKLFHHTELQWKWTKFLVDAGLCDISMTVAVLMDVIKKKHCLLKFLYKFSHQYALPFKIISNLNTQNFNVWLLDTQHK